MATCPTTLFRRRRFIELAGALLPTTRRGAGFFCGFYSALARLSELLVPSEKFPGRLLYRMQFTSGIRGFRLCATRGRVWTRPFGFRRCHCDGTAAADQARGWTRE